MSEGSVYTLSYADDMVLVESKDEIKSMMKRLEVYLGEKNLALNTENTKIMRFKRGTGRLGKRYWRWGGQKIEEIREYKCLGYVMQRNGGQEAHKGKSKEGGNGNETGMGVREKEVWERLGEKNMVIRQASLDMGYEMGYEVEIRG